MAETKALAVRPQLTQDDWHMILEIAPAMHAARWFGVSNMEQAAAIMLKGRELGLPPAASLEFIRPVMGRPALAPMGALALIHNSPLIERVEIKDLRDDKGNPTGCQVTMKRVSGFEYTALFTIEDAKRAGLVKQDSGWDKYPGNMCRWRAVGFCADIVCPDVLGGLKRADELGADLTPDGNVIEGSWSVAPCPPASAAPVAAPTVEPPKPAIDLNDLVTRFGAEAIMAANNGKIPGTEAELLTVAVALESGNA